MTYKTDRFGIVFSCADAKLYNGDSTWATKLSQLAKGNRIVRIITYSLPEVAYVREQFQRRPSGIFIIAHSKFQQRAQEFQTAFPGIAVAVHNEVHSKILLIEPGTVYISSANFGRSHWHETSVGFHSKEAHDWYVKQSFEPLWIESKKL